MQFKYSTPDHHDLKFRKLEWLMISLLILISNLHLFTGNLGQALIYRFEIDGFKDLASLILHPFVHVSAYHFLLDTGAFCLLYFLLKEFTLYEKWFMMLCSGIMSLLLVSLITGSDQIDGFCGLSGIGHGLMAVCGLSLSRSANHRMIAIIVISTICLKSFFEILSGQALFLDMHQGFCGQPLPASHLGGAIGGCISFIMLKRKRIITKILNLDPVKKTPVALFNKPGRF